MGRFYMATICGERGSESDRDVRGGRKDPLLIEFIVGQARFVEVVSIDCPKGRLVLHVYAQPLCSGMVPWVLFMLDDAEDLNNTRPLKLLEFARES